MRKFFLVLCLLVPFAAQAQTQPGKPPPTVPYQTAIKSELDKVFNGLVDQLKMVDNLAASLKTTASRKPEDTQQQINEAAGTLSALADRLQPTADLAGQLTALRNAAAVHRQRIQEIAKDAIEEGDRTELLKSWAKIVMDADKASAALENMRERLLAVLSKLRMRQAAVSEFLLAGQYQAALDSLKSWVTELNTTITGLHRLIDPVKPSV